MTTATLPYAPAPAAAIANLDPFFGPDAPPLPDPEPLPDGMQQNPYILHLMQILADVLTRHRNVFVDTNTIVYYDPANGNRRFQPDIYAAFDVDPAAIRQRNGYVIWEVGKPPDFVLEVASETTADHDTGRKRELYAALGIREYWRFDAVGNLYGQRLVGEYLDADGVYQPFPMHTEGERLVWGYSPLLELNLRWHNGWPELQDPETGEILLDRRGVRLAMEAAQQEAELAQLERDTAQQERDAVQQERDIARQEREAARQERNAVRQERDTAQQERDAVRQERDTARQERDTVQQEREAARQKRDAARQERDAAQQERDAVQQNLDAAQQETEAARKEREAAQQERDAALAAAADYREQVRQLQERLREREGSAE